MLGFIPTVGRTPLLGGLAKTLLEEGVRLIVLDADTGKSRIVLGEETYFDPNLTWLLRPGWGIYRSWNYALEEAARLEENILILNDDVILGPGAASAMGHLLAGTDYALVGFSSQSQCAWYGDSLIEEVPASYERGHDLCMWAFAANPALCARCDERFQWYCGDDDLVYQTKAAGGRIGIARVVHALHPRPGSSNDAHPEADLRPPGWHAHDLALIREKWAGVPA